MNKQGDANKKERGQSLVELSVSLVFLMSLVAGVVDFGRAYFTFIALRDAAQEGAAYGSAYPTFCTQIRERIKGSSQNPVDLSVLGDDDIDIIIGGYPCEVAVQSNQACAPNEIRVEVTLDDVPISTPFLGSIIGTQSLSLTSQVTDVVLTNPCGSS